MKKKRKIIKRLFFLEYNFINIVICCEIKAKFETVNFQYSDRTSIRIILRFKRNMKYGKLYVRNKVLFVI